MGCDIHSFAIDGNGEPIDGVWADGKTNNPNCEYTHDEGRPFGWRNYGVFGFLADVRNYSEVPQISEPRGIPDDLRQYMRDRDRLNQYTDIGDHSYSWLSVAELLAFDYDVIFDDVRSGVRTAIRKFLGDDFFNDLAELQRIGADRVVFGFDG